MEKAKQKALSLVGQGYLYGAKGQICSEAFRAQQARQYPEQAKNILETGAKWDGQPVWDCAQLTRAVAAEAGVELVSGATSQWNQTDWRQTGLIDTLPEGEMAFVFRHRDGKMQHTGVALGDGTCVHARGTAYGVVRQSMSEYAWTHWALLPLSGVRTAWVTAQTGSTVNVRKEPGGKITARLKLGAEVEVTGESAGWSRIRCGSVSGYMQSAFLRYEDALLCRIEAIEARLERAGI